MQIQTTMRFHCTPIRTAKIRSSDCNTKCCQDREKLNQFCIAGGPANQLSPGKNTPLPEATTTPGTSWHFFQRNEDLCSSKSVYSDINCNFAMAKF